MNYGDPAYGWFRLFRANNLGPKKMHAIHRWLAQENTAVEHLLESAWPEFQRLLPKFGRQMFDAIRETDSPSIATEYESLVERGVRLVHLEDVSYPTHLLERLGSDAPPLLFCTGRLQLLNEPGVAIVGSRSASDDALAVARRLTGELARKGKNVVSGYARGIDTMAHLGALSEEGTTTIVLGSGILDFSPKKDMEDVGWERDSVVISQFAPGERWRPRNAMTRNKLVCGLSEALIVVEAGPERDERGTMSGTFAAAKVAREIGVPVFVIDPCSLSSHPEGNESLIAQGALKIQAEEESIAVISRFLVSNPDAKPLAREGQLSLLDRAVAG